MSVALNTEQTERATRIMSDRAETALTKATALGDALHRIITMQADGQKPTTDDMTVNGVQYVSVESMRTDAYVQAERHRTLVECVDVIAIIGGDLEYIARAIAPARI